MDDMPIKTEEEELDASGSFDIYLEYNKVLRTWFVAYGAGGPALLLTSERLSKNLAAAGNLRTVALLFFAGVAAQVLGALINKIANWYVHSAYHQVNVTRSIKHKCAEWVVNQFWIDVLVDVVTVVVFGLAAWLLLTALAPG